MTSPTFPYDIEINGHTYQVQRALSGNCLFAERALSDYVIKISDDAATEALTIADLKNNANPKFTPYLPAFVETGMVDAGFANVFEYEDGFYSLTEVKDAYPDGVDVKDMAWMYRRILTPLGYAHQTGYMHAAVLPQHVLIHPEKHGLILIDWTHSIALDYEPDDVQRVFQVPGFEKWYPPEWDTEDAGTELDLYMATNLMLWLIGGDPESATLPDGIEREYRVFFNKHLERDHKNRPSDAWRSMKYFDDLLVRLYGRRRFHPFAMPIK